MKILVLGSSNSIGQASYIGHIAKNPDIKIINKSIGASSSTAGLYSALSSGHAGSDYAIIDYEINEEGSIKYGLKSDDDVLNNVRSLAFALRQQGISPVLAIMPTTRGLKKQTRAEALHLQVCREDDIPFFNIAELFRMASSKGADWGPLMRDGFHMSATATPIVGQAFMEALTQLHNAPKLEQEWTGQVVATRIIPAGSLMTPERRVQRASGHRGGWHALLRENKKIILPVGSDERLIGLLINSGSLGGKVAFRGAGPETVKQLVIYFGAEKAGWFISVMVDLKQPLTGTPDGITVELLPATAQQTENTLHQQPILDGRYGEVEIESFVVASKLPKPATCLTQMRPSVSLDLMQAIAFDHFAERLLEASLAKAA
jgi:hypothetical protein